MNLAEKFDHFVILKAAENSPELPDDKYDKVCRQRSQIEEEILSQIEQATGLTRKQIGELV